MKGCRRPEAGADARCKGPVQPWSQGELLLDPELGGWLERAQTERPRRWGDCEDYRDGCPFVSCRYHLWAERPLAFERLAELEPEAWGDTCALAVAERTQPPRSRRLEKRRSPERQRPREGAGEPIGRPGPLLERQGAGWRWVSPEPPFDAPHESNRAVVGRFLGGLSRETVRLDEVRALRALRTDPAIVEAFPWLADIEPEGVDDDDDDAGDELGLGGR